MRLKYTRPQRCIHLQLVKQKPKQAPRLKPKLSEFSKEPEMCQYGISEKGKDRSSAQCLQPTPLTKRLLRDDLGLCDEKHILNSLRLEAYDEFPVT